jgi:hypothetical protein
MNQDSSESRAKPETVAERIDSIADMMERLEWQRGKSAKRLAADWGVSVSAIENYSAEASRRVTADADDCRRDITAGCRKLFRDAVDSGKPKDARAVGELWVSVSGAKAADRHEVSASVNATPEEAAALVRQKFGDHASKAADTGGDCDAGSESPVEPEET